MQPSNATTIVNAKSVLMGTEISILIIELKIHRIEFWFICLIKL